MVLGHSWGTLVAVALALRYPRNVKALILASGYYYPTARADVLLLSAPAVPLIGDILSHTVSPILSRLMWPFLLRKIFGPRPVPKKFKGFPEEMAVRPYALWPPLRLWPSSRARHFKNTARRLLSRRAYFNSMRRGSEFGRQVAVDFQSDADFHECRSGPVHSHLPTLHICQQPRLGHIRSQDGAHGSDLNQASTSFLAWSLARP